jgi:hypothetical protein
MSFARTPALFWGGIVQGAMGLRRWPRWGVHTIFSVVYGGRFPVLKAFIQSERSGVPCGILDPGLGERSPHSSGLLGPGTQVSPPYH